MLYYVSLSDSYPYSENESDQDSIIPEEYLGRLEQTEMLHFELKSVYRNRFLTRLQIAETDSVFVYFQVLDSIAAFVVSDLSLIAVLNPYYSSYYNEGITFYDYMIGFDFGTIQSGDFVVIGNQNPFQTGKLKPVLWKEVDPSMFPEQYNIVRDSGRLPNVEIGATFRAEVDNLIYYLQNTSKGEWTSARRVAVTNKFTKELVFQTILYTGESADFAPLNGLQTDNPNEQYQWAGQLFKDQPDVLYGLMFESFGCPSIYFMNQNYAPIYLACDNRH